VPISLPNLDDLSWEDLVTEGRSLIPASAPDWTNHNPSDPGITLLELFAYLAEKLMYQVNRITDSNMVEFLSLINGPKWKQHLRLDEEGLSDFEVRAKLRRAASIDEKRKAVTALSELRRAVTPADFELLACEVPMVARAKSIVQRNLSSENPAVRMLAAPGHVSIVILPEGELHPSLELLARVRQTLEPARLLTTRVHVVGARYVKLGCRVAITPVGGTPRAVLRDEAVKRLRLFLDPHNGWFDGKGWPWGRSLYVSELYQLLSEIQGVDSVGPMRDTQGAWLDEVMVDAAESGRLQRNSRAEIEAVALYPDELIEPNIDPKLIVIASDI
jgi:hypothetical protein